MNTEFLWKRVVPGVAALGVALIAAFAYGQHQLSNERRIHEGKAADFNKKYALLQKRYTEERDLRVSLEGQKRSHQGELERLRKEHAAMNEEGTNLTQQLAALETRNKELGKSLSQFDAAWRTWQEKTQQMMGAVRERDEAIKQLSADRQRLEGELKVARAEAAQRGANNARLCLIAEDLLEAYRNKGVFRTLLENEPLTQIKKVELEHLVQNYRELIDKETVRSRDNTSN